MKIKKLCSIYMIAASIALVGCSAVPKPPLNQNSSMEEDKIGESSDNAYPITMNHAFGDTVIESKPSRIVTISWGNQDVPLALGVVPVGVSQVNYGVLDGDNLLPWTSEKFRELGAESPNVFRDTDGIDYEAIHDANPDVILAAYSGITKEEYNLLSQIAPVVAYKKDAWQTLWRDQILINAAGMGMKEEGEALVKELEEVIANKVSAYPQLKGKTAAFCFFNPSDMGKFYVYMPTDPRAAFLTDLGFLFSEEISKIGEEFNHFTAELSAENADVLKDVDIIVAYGNADLLKSLQNDSLLGTIDAVKNGAVALIEDNTPLAASGTPSALSIKETIDDYLEILGEAADKIQ